MRMSSGHQRPRGILFDIGDTLLYQESLDPVLGLDRLLQLATNSDLIDAAGFQDAGKSLFHDVVSWRVEIRECGLNHIELRFQSFLRLL